MQLAILLLIAVGLPIAWFLVDLNGSILARRILGVAAILSSFAVAALVGVLRDFNANVYFTTATKQLLTESLRQLEAGRTNAVIREWSRASEQFNPTYENRARYQQIVDDATTHMKQP